MKAPQAMLLASEYDNVRERYTRQFLLRSDSRYCFSRKISQVMCRYGLSILNRELLSILNRELQECRVYITL